MTAEKVTPIRQGSHAAELMALFPASNRSHATFSVGSEERSETGKTEVKYITERSAITELHWARHLSGARPLVAGLACDDGLCSVSVVDVDIYGLDPRGLVLAALHSELPLYVRSSKSRGVHIVALHAPLTVRQSNQLALGIAWKLGLLDEMRRRKTESKIEYFPKAQANSDRLQNGLNMPYLGGRYAGKTGFLRPDMSELPIADFLASVLKLSKAQIDELLECGREAKKERKGKQKTSSNKKTQYSDRERAYGSSMLKRYSAELENAPPGQRNNLLNRHAFRLGTMIAAGWIEHNEVDSILKLAVSGWADQAKTIDTLTRSLAAGEEVPHTPLPEAGSMSEDSAALEFVERNADILRFDCEEKKWYEWVGSHWKRLKGQRAFDAARKLVRELAAEGSPRLQNIVSRVAFCRAVEKFAQSDQDFGIEVTHDIWDPNPMLLGTPGGTVELVSGLLRDSVPSEHISTITGVAPTTEADCPLWSTFLKQTTNNDPELINFLQRLFGYALIGDNREHLLVFLYGTGGNGKGVFIETIGNILGEYRQEAAPDLLTETMFSKHTTDLAMLSEARLVTATETSSDKYWDEVRVKQLTGGNKVTSRKMHQDNTTHVPKYLPVVIGNFKPKLRNVDDAMMRRLYIIPFKNRVRPQDADTELSEKLKGEYPGILRWLIDGCLMYQRDKFRDIPASVQATTAEYFQGEDLHGRWLEFDIEAGSDADSLSAAECFSMWRYFAEQAGENAGNQNQLTAKLKTRFEAVSRRGFTYFKRIRRRRLDGDESSLV